MNRETRGLLLGLVIGDGYVSMKRDHRYPTALPSASLVVRHSAKQKAYAEHKASLVHKALGGKKPKVVEFNNNGYPGVRFTKTNKYFRIIRKRLYAGGEKVLTPKILDQLTEHSLALWWMDDGSLYMRRTKEGRVHGRQGVLSLYSPKQEANLVRDWLVDKYGIQASVYPHKGRYRLSFGSSALRELITVIHPYVIPEMAHKIDMKYQRPSYQARVPGAAAAPQGGWWLRYSPICGETRKWR